MSDGDIELWTLTELRTCVVPNEPDLVVLEIKAGEDVRHYGIHRNELTVLAERLRRDALLLSAK